jgi:hypothetical protein
MGFLTNIDPEPATCLPLLLAVYVVSLVFVNSVPR